MSFEEFGICGLQREKDRLELTGRNQELYTEDFEGARKAEKRDVHSKEDDWGG